MDSTITSSSAKTATNESKTNILHKYSSYSYGFILSVLTKEEYKKMFSGETPNLSVPGVVVASSGKLSTPSASSSYKFVETKIGVDTAKFFDSFIDDVSITSSLGFNLVNGITNAYDYRFTVTEPYSLMLFLNGLQETAKKLGYQNYYDSPVLLTLVFDGINEDNTRSERIHKYFTIKLTNIEVSVNNAGTSYHISAYNFGSQALEKDVCKLPSDVQISEKTVAGVFDSLQSKLNNSFQCTSKFGTVSVEGTNTTINLFELDDNRYTFDIDKKIKAASFLDQHKPKTFKFSAGQPITEVISSIIRATDYVKSDSSTGVLQVFKVFTQIDISGGLEKKKYRFKIVSISRDATNILTTQATTSLYVIKEYNYLYTGQNIDILSFRLGYDFTAMNVALDFQNNTSVSGTSVAVSGGRSAVTPVIGVGPGANALEVTNNFQNSVFNKLLTHETVENYSMDLEIIGDPNFLITFPNEEEVKKTRLFLESLIKINVKHPTDIDTTTGKMRFEGMPTVSGYYYVSEIQNTFRDGKFTQTLSLLRRFGPVDEGVKNDAIPVSITAAANKNNITAAKKPSLSIANLPTDDSRNDIRVLQGKTPNLRF